MRKIGEVKEELEKREERGRDAMEACKGKGNEESRKKTIEVMRKMTDEEDKVMDRASMMYMMEKMCEVAM